MRRLSLLLRTVVAEGAAGTGTSEKRRAAVMMGGGVAGDLSGVTSATGLGGVAIRPFRPSPITRPLAPFVLQGEELHVVPRRFRRPEIKGPVIALGS